MTAALRQTHGGVRLPAAQLHPAQAVAASVLHVGSGPFAGALATMVGGCQSAGTSGKTAGTD